MRELSTQEKLEDLRYLFEVFRDNHPYLALKARVEGSDWLASLPEFEAWVRAAGGNQEFARAMKRIVALVNNGHTAIVGGRQWDYLKGLPRPWAREGEKTSRETVDYWFRLAQDDPLRPDPFLAVYHAGDYVVVEVAPAEETQARVRVGSRVLAVDGVPVHRYVNAHRGRGFLWYDPLRQGCFDEVLKLTGAADTVTVTLEEPDGRGSETELPRPALHWPMSYRPLPWYGEGNRVLTAVIGQGKVGYVRVPQMAADAGQDKAMLFEFFQSVRDLPSLIIDIRGNGGGNDDYWTQNLVGLLGRAERVRKPRSKLYVTWRTGRFLKPFVEAKGLTMLPPVPPDAIPPGVLPPELLAPGFESPRHFEYPIDTSSAVGYRGKVFLLVDRGVYSSAESFAAFCKATGWATVVGGCTGGDGIGHDPAVVALPNSGMLVRFPLTMGLNADWSVNEEAHTRPDVLVEQSREDLVKYVELLRSRGTLPGPTPEVDTCLRRCLEMCLEEGGC
ncbi:MAG: hypothetical protein K6T75_04670 [Acetobacteraceae bacterium]|nr:hypothetical protein [Acetobacteraceae bacterium]